jgi:hypothetical protein
LIQINRAGPIALLLAAVACQHSAEGNRRRVRVNRLVKWALVATTGLTFLGEAHAVDLSGAWATQVDECSQVFVRKGRAKQIGFAAFSEQHGGGFIVEAGRLRGKFASCKIKSKKEDGEYVNIIAGCATDIMLSNVHFTLKVLGPDTIQRTFPGMEDMAISYYRCPI